jgi:murein DD-endopeptidase MepM/ murein hydrolase activator NlpD
VLLVLLVVAGPVAPAWADVWRWPLDGPPSVSRPFVAPAHRYAAGHRGADLPGVPGAPVRAAGDGLVSYAGLVAGRGVVVVVHGDLRTTYEPVEALVGVGALVAAGEVVGVLEPGHAGCPALACLHWGLRRGDDYLDPVRLVSPGPVRLLPLDAPAPAALVSEPVVAARTVASEPAPAAPAESPAPTDVYGGAAAAAALLGAAAVAAARRRS